MDAKALITRRNERTSGTNFPRLSSQSKCQHAGRSDLESLLLPALLLPSIDGQKDAEPFSRNVQLNRKRNRSNDVDERAHRQDERTNWGTSQLHTHALTHSQHCWCCTLVTRNPPQMPSAERPCQCQ